MSSIILPDKSPSASVLCQAIIIINKTDDNHQRGEPEQVKIALNNKYKNTVHNRLSKWIQVSEIREHS